MSLHAWLTSPRLNSDPGVFDSNPKYSLILIDGNNFYNRLKRLNRNLKINEFNFIKFLKFLNIENTYTANYYIGEIRKKKSNRKSHKLFKQQQQLFSSLRKQNINIKTGYIINNNGIYHEKGVDVQIAIDMVYGALKNKYDKCYLVSSDTDLLPAVKMARREHKDVIYVGFENHLSRALKYNCSKTLIIKKAEMESN